MQLISRFTQKSTDFDTLVDLLKSAELSRDLSALEVYLAPYLNSDLSSLPLFEQANLNRFIGFFYIHSGKAKNIAGFQEKGADYLTAAIRQFEELGAESEAVEAEITLGWSYYLKGETYNFEPFLLNALYRPDLRRDTVFAIKVSLLIVYFKESKLDDGLEIINELDGIIERAENKLYIWQFYHNAGLLFRRSGDYQKAKAFYKRALHFAGALNNRRFEGLTNNCMAFCSLAAGELNQAIFYSNSSIEIFSQLKDIGLKAECLDTKALILFKLQNFQDALNTIISAIAYFREGESYLKFAEALWNKIEILYALRKKTEIFETFRELSNLCHERLELKYQQEFYRKFEDLCFMFFGKDYDEKKKEFETAMIKPLLDKYGIVEAARRLGFSNHQRLSKIVSRNDLNPNQMNRKVRADENEISEVSLKQRFDFNKPINKVLCGVFKVNERLARLIFNKNESLLLLIIQDGRGRNGDLIMMSENDSIFIAELVIEDGATYFVNLETGSSAASSAEIFGRIIGFAPTSELKNEPIFFAEI